MHPTLRLDRGFPRRMRYEGRFESVLEGGSEKPLVSPGYCNVPEARSHVPPRVRLGPEGAGPAAGESGENLQGGVGFPVTHCCVCNRRLEIERNVTCEIPAARRGALHLRILLTK